MWRLEQGKFFFFPANGLRIPCCTNRILSAQPNIEGFSYTLPNTRAVNNRDFLPAQVINPFQHGQFPTLINLDDDQYSNVHGPWQTSSALPFCDASEKEDLLAPSPGFCQSGNNFFPTYRVGNTVPQSHVPLLSESTSLELLIDATAEVFVSTQHPTFIGERSNEEGLHDLHGPLQTLEPNLCQVCILSFPSNAELERHAQSLQHKAFGCKCGNSYARLDILKRHCDRTPKFPCPHCNRYTGANAFPREDHLTQHLRTYHRINNNNTTGDDNNAPMQFNCTRPDCTQQQRSFEIKSQYTTHMRRVHNYSPYPCLVQGCVKNGGKGYFRKSDWFKHSQEVHSIERLG